MVRSTSGSAMALSHVRLEPSGTLVLPSFEKQRKRASSSDNGEAVARG